MRKCRGRGEVKSERSPVHHPQSVPQPHSSTRAHPRSQQRNYANAGRKRRHRSLDTYTRADDGPCSAVSPLRHYDVEQPR